MQPLDPEPRPTQPEKTGESPPPSPRPPLFGPLLLYLLVAIVVAGPLVSHLGSSLPLQAHAQDEDLLSNLWAFWWTKVSMIDGADSLFFTRYLFHPDGTTLTMSAMSPAATVAALPVMAAVPGLPGVHLAWNLNLIATFVLSGLGAFLLAHRATGNTAAALVAGLVFSLCPYRFDHLRHVNLSCTQWLPFVFWTVLGLLDGGGAAWAIGLALSLTLVVASSATYMAFLALFLPLFLAGWAFSHRAEGARSTLVRLTSVLLPLAAAVFLSLPILLPSLSDMAFVEFETPLPEDAVSFAYPIELFVMRGAPCYLGLAALLIATYAALSVPAAAPFTVLAITGAALAPGPALKTAAGATAFPLPYALVRTLLPFLAANRFCERFLVFWWLGACVLIAVAVTRIAQRPGPKSWLVAALAGAAVLFDLAPGRLAAYTPPVPAVYARLAQAPAGWPVYEFPADYLTNRRFMYYQVVHGRPICQGHLSRRSIDSYRIEEFDAASRLTAMILVVHSDFKAEPHLLRKLDRLFERYDRTLFAKEGPCTVWLLRLKGVRRPAAGQPGGQG